MSHAGWGDVWNLVLALMRAQPVQFQILMGLTVAFAAVMIVEGLRASFLPGYRTPPHLSYNRNSAPPKPAAATRASVSDAKLLAPRASASFRPREVERARSNLKRPKPRISTHRAVRPKIRRVTLNGFTNSFPGLPG